MYFCTHLIIPSEHFQAKNEYFTIYNFTLFIYDYGGTLSKPILLTCSHVFVCLCVCVVVCERWLAMSPDNHPQVRRHCGAQLLTTLVPRGLVICHWKCICSPCYPIPTLSLCIPYMGYIPTPIGQLYNMSIKCTVKYQIMLLGSMCVLLSVEWELSIYK